MREDLQINNDFTYSNYQAEEIIIPVATVTGGTGSPVLTINGTVTGPSVTFSGGSSGFSYAPVGTTTLNLVSALTTKGDIYGHTGAAGTRLAVGADGTVLTADSGQATGLRWATAAAGTVTSVAMTVPAFLSVAGSPVTTSGTLAVTLSGTALPLANGGTGATTVAGVLAALGIAKQNSAASAPTVNDDNTQGYSVNSLWTDTAADDLYGCVDASTGAAVWKKLSP